MIAFCAWFSSRDESSGIGEPSVAAAQVAASGCCQTASLWEEVKYFRCERTPSLSRLGACPFNDTRDRERERERTEQ